MVSQACFCFLILGLCCTLEGFYKTKINNSILKSIYFRFKFLLSSYKGKNKKTSERLESKMGRRLLSLLLVRLMLKGLLLAVEGKASMGVLQNRFMRVESYGACQMQPIHKEISASTIYDCAFHCLQDHLCRRFQFHRASSFCKIIRFWFVGETFSGTGCLIFNKGTTC